MNKTFSSAVKSESGGMGEEQKPLTIEQKVDNLSMNMANMLNEQANALNAIAMWINENDKKVAKAGGVLQWAMKEQAKAQRLAERKAQYQANRKKSS